MSREEAIKLLRKLRETIDRNNKYGEAEEMAIQALEQEPCEDAISRKTVKSEYKRQLESKLKDDDRGIDLSELANCTAFNKFIDDIPSVNPQPCKDEISRQAIIDGIKYINSDNRKGKIWKI